MSARDRHADGGLLLAVTCRRSHPDPRHVPVDCRFANSLRPRRSPLAPGPSSVYGWDVAAGAGGAPHA